MLGSFGGAVVSRLREGLRPAGDASDGRLSGGGGDEGFDFGVELARYAEGRGLSIAAEEACHGVVGEADFSIALVDEEGDGCVGAGIMDMLCHGHHDQGVAENDAEDPGSCGGGVEALRFLEELAMIEARELHESRGPDRAVDNRLDGRHG